MTSIQEQHRSLEVLQRLGNAPWLGQISVVFRSWIFLQRWTFLFPYLPKFPLVFLCVICFPENQVTKGKSIICVSMVNNYITFASMLLGPYQTLHFLFYLLHRFLCTSSNWSSWCVFQGDERTFDARNGQRLCVHRTVGASLLCTGVPFTSPFVAAKTSTKVFPWSAMTTGSCFLGWALDDRNVVFFLDALRDGSRLPTKHKRHCTGSFGTASSSTWKQNVLPCCTTRNAYPDGDFDCTGWSTALFVGSINRHHPGQLSP